MNESHSSPWGCHAPSGLPFLLRMMVRLGLARGPVRKALTRLWLRRYPDLPVDIRYRGMKIRLHPQQNVTDRKLLLRSGWRDSVELNILRELSDKSVFVDIGANMGYYSLMAAGFGFQRVVAIEPSPELLPRLHFNIAANALDKVVHVEPCALSEAPGKMFLSRPGDLGAASICTQREHQADVEVCVQTLEAVLKKLAITRISALKIDVEGHEDRVLLPYLKALPSERLPGMLLIEFIHRHLWKEDLTAWMLDHGYRSRLQTRSNLMLERIR